MLPSHHKHLKDGTFYTLDTLARSPHIMWRARRNKQPPRWRPHSNERASGGWEAEEGTHGRRHDEWKHGLGDEFRGVRRAHSSGDSN